MAIRYVDSAAAGAGNGTSWANAWTSIGAITGVGAGDTVFISGGVTTRTYNMPAFWQPAVGSAGNPIRYQIGQEAGHNGVAIFNYTGATPNVDMWMFGLTNGIISGDAGDGQCHFRLANYRRGVTGAVTNCTIEYVDMMAGLDFAVGMGGDQPTGFRFLNNRVKGDDLINGNNLLNFGVPASPVWDDILIQGNYFLMVKETGGTGDGYDCIAGKSGVSVIANTFEWYDDAYEGFQHADGWQALGGQFIRFIGNLVIGCPNYSLYLEAFENFLDVEVYNNWIVYTEDMNAHSPLAIACGVSNSFTGDSIQRVLIANNTAVNGGGNCFVVTMNNISFPFVPCDFIDCFIENNLSVDGRGINTTGATGITIQDNVELTNAQALSRFVQYVQYAGASNNMHPTAANTQCVGQGTDLSAVFTTDYDEEERTPPWTIGAFNPPSSPPPVTGTGIMTSQGFLLRAETGGNILRNA